ncbi:MAG: response regulator [Calditerrivibrio sp.]|nr:response regulator [Calditerrivibrio sp.]
MPTIIVADDESFNRELIIEFLSDQGYKLLEAENGLQVLNLLSEHDVDLVLLDIGMPLMNGIEVLREIRGAKAHNYPNIPIIVITAFPDEKYRCLELGANDFITKPIDIFELQLRIKNTLNVKLYADVLQNFNNTLEKMVAERTFELQEALKRSKRAELEISLRLGKATEYRDFETGDHTKRMSEYSALLAELYGLGKEEVELIHVAAPLHDIGKVGIPDAILLKPGRYTKEEFDIMKLHVNIGLEMLKDHEDFPVLKAGYQIIAGHHENWDGSGYPFGKKGDDIHIYGQICKIADVFDALTTKRVYKEPYSIEEAVKIMVADRGKMFNPKLLDIFIENLSQFLTIKEKFKDQEELPPILKIMQEIYKSV